MGERTSHAPGTFSWADLGTDDGEAAKAFYGGLFGWELEDVPVPDSPPYTIARLGGKAVCAIYERSERDAPVAWLAYVTVASADETAARASELGAAVLQEPFDVMSSGRMALLADPTGAVLGIWEPRESIGAELVNDPGAICLDQLNTSDPDAARRFYAELFGWRTEPTGTPEQEYWGIFNGEVLNGGMMPLPPDAGAPSHWMIYVTTADLDGSVARIAELGGAVMVEPMPIPSGRIAVAHDPQGAVFGLFEGDVDP